MEKITAHVAEWKKNKVEEIKRLIDSYKTIGIIDMANMPSSQLQKMKAQLKDRILIVMTRLRLIKLALENKKDSKKGLSELEKYFKGVPALIFSNEDSFKISKTLIKNKSPAAAKPGQTAPYDIMIPKGPTPFTPGPVIAELSQLGLKTSVEAGKISIKDDTVVAKAGAVISDKLANVLAKLGIEPMEIGLNLVATYENGNVYDGSILRIDEKEYTDNIKKLYKESLNLALNINFLIKDTMEITIKKAYLDTLALANSIKFEVDKETAKPEVQEQKSSTIKQSVKEAGLTGTIIEAKPVDYKQFKEHEKVAQDILKNLQDQKLRGK